MRILVQVNSTNIFESENPKVKFAVIDISAEAKQHITERFALYNTVKKFSDDLAELRFYGCSFITFYGDLCFVNELPDDKFYATGYLLIPDDVVIPEENIETSFNILILDEQRISILANISMEYEDEIITSDIPINICF